MGFDFIIINAVDGILFIFSFGRRMNFWNSFCQGWPVKCTGGSVHKRSGGFNNWSDQVPRLSCQAVLGLEDNHSVINGGGEVDKPNVGHRVKLGLGLPWWSKSVGLSGLDVDLRTNNLDTGGWEVEFSVVANSIGGSGYHFDIVRSNFDLQ